MPKLALWAQAVEIANLPLRRDLFAKNVLMIAQRNFCLGNSPLRLDVELYRYYFFPLFDRLNGQELSVLAKYINIIEVKPGE